MYDLGKTLKSSRNRKFLTIEEVSSITKIKEHYLAALEEEDFEQLPARVYSVGFINNLANLYELPATELILAYDRLKDKNDNIKVKKDFTSFNKSVYEKSENRKFDNLTQKTDKYDDQEIFEETFSKIKELSLDENETSDVSISEIDDLIESNKDEIKAISLIKDIERDNPESFNENNINSDNTFPTSKVMLEFEELIREEERFNTQKLRKLEADRNINKTKNRVAQNKGFGLKYESKSGASMMILILLSVAILVLLYIIIKALITK
ncbi:MAG: helix-turn-helix domain-containing protein [Firmicutes bacterium]|nr:helix-turn-helix domain-containing protein [Bacillota bacterium]